MARSAMLRDEYELLNWVKKLAQERNIPAQELTDLIKVHRQKIHFYLENGHVDPLEKSISDEWRHWINDDGEHGVDYTFVKDNGETDEEIQDYIESEVGYPPIHSSYDCTGKRFTTFVHWRRTPGGIALIHHWALDV